ncbi:hypothetical protein NUSPORA_01730 [Nucleospora cyclopteri]
MLIKFVKDGSSVILSAWKSTLKNYFNFNNQIGECYKVLGVTENDSLPVITEKYNFLISKNVKELGGSRFINDKIREAYVEISKEKRIK